MCNFAAEIIRERERGGVFIVTASYTEVNTLCRSPLSGLWHEARREWTFDYPLKNSY